LFDKFCFLVLVFTNVSLLLCGVFFVELVDGMFGLRDSLLALSLAGLIASLNVLCLFLAPLPDDFRFILI